MGKVTQLATAAASGVARALKLDGWMNVITGLGTSKDKSAASIAVWRRLSEMEAEELYAGDDLAEKIVDMVPNEAMRPGYKITGLEDNVLRQVQDRQKAMEFDSRFWEACHTARLHGGALLIKVTDDMGNPAAPIKDDAKLRGLVCLTRWEAQCEPGQLDTNLASPTFGQPLSYTLYPNNATGAAVTAQLIHASRVIRFDGARLPNRLRVGNNWWHDSVLAKTYNAIRNFGIAHESAAQTLVDFSVAVFKIKGLADQLASQGAEGDASVIKRVELVNLTKAVARAVIVDADGEDFDHRTRTVTGFKEILEKIEDRLVAAQPAPGTILLGRSPGGLGSTGGHEMKVWFNYLDAWRQNYLKPKLLRGVAGILADLGQTMEGVDIEFNPLEQMDEKDQVDMRNKQALTDQIYESIGALDSNEIAQSRFGGDKYSLDTKLDMSLRDGDGSLPAPDVASALDPAAPADPAQQPNGAPTEPDPAPAPAPRAPGAPRIE